jgi:hypothetical protein
MEAKHKTLFAQQKKSEAAPGKLEIKISSIFPPLPSNATSLARLQITHIFHFYFVRVSIDLFLAFTHKKSHKNHFSLENQEHTEWPTKGPSTMHFFIMTRKK